MYRLYDTFPSHSSGAELQQPRSQRWRKVASTSKGTSNTASGPHCSNHRHSKVPITANKAQPSPTRRTCGQIRYIAMPAMNNGSTRNSTGKPLLG